MTNGDKIRQMDDDELARWLCESRHPNDCNECSGYDYCLMDGGKANGLKEWLKMEVEE